MDSFDDARQLPVEGFPFIGPYVPGKLVAVKGPAKTLSYRFVPAPQGRYLTFLRGNVTVSDSISVKVCAVFHLGKERWTLITTKERGCCLVKDPSTGKVYAPQFKGSVLRWTQTDAS